MLSMTFSTFVKLLVRRYVRFILIIFILLIIVFVGYFYKNNIFYTDPTTLAESANQALIKKVGTLVILPQDEIPTIAKVSNPEMLKDRIFFTDAKMGDVVLIYTNAKKAILYDPVLNKIVNMSTVNIGDTKKITPTTPDIKNGKIRIPKSANPNQF